MKDNWRKQFKELERNVYTKERRLDKGDEIEEKSDNWEKEIVMKMKKLIAYWTKDNMVKYINNWKKFGENNQRIRRGVQFKKWREDYRKENVEERGQDRRKDDIIKSVRNWKKMEKVIE